MTRPSAAFYCVADDRYFLGAAGMINSLRRAGHDEPVVVLDCGLTRSQRDLLGPQATLVPNPREDRPPVLLSTFGPLLCPADVMILIDTDMVVNRRLDDLVEIARGGRIAAVRDWQDRFCPEWAELPGLGRVEPGPYVSAGLVALPADPGLEVLGLMQELEEDIDFERTFTRRNDAGYPLVFADQDVLNAVLRASAGADRLHALDYRLSPMLFLEHLQPVGDHGLRHAYDDGVEPLALHQAGGSKPWLELDFDGLYSRLLRRHLTDDGLAIQVPAREMPRRMRRGAAASLERTLIARALATRGRLGRWRARLMPGHANG